jgi:hypothetical protein
MGAGSRAASIPVPIALENRFSYRIVRLEDACPLFATGRSLGRRDGSEGWVGGMGGTAEAVPFPKDLLCDRFHHVAALKSGPGNRSCDGGDIVDISHANHSDGRGQTADHLAG